jgi:hypothetical protein
MLREFEDRGRKRERRVLRWMFGVLAALILLALVVGIASSS